MAKTTKKNKVRVEAEGQAHIQATFNNIIISLTNNRGQIISWSSAGKMGRRTLISSILETLNARNDFLCFEEPFE